MTSRVHIETSELLLFPHLGICVVRHTGQTSAAAGDLRRRGSRAALRSPQSSPTATRLLLAHATA